MSEKEAEKLMYAIGDVSEEMLKEAEDYSENIKKMSFRQKRLKNMQNGMAHRDSRSSYRLCVTCI